LILGAVVALISLCVLGIYVAQSLRANGDSPSQSDEHTDDNGNEGGGILEPAARRGGTRIVFDSRRGSSLDLYVMKIDGSGLQPITTAPGAERGPSWSPDGSRIAYYGADDEQANYDIFVINADGTDPRNLTNSPTVDDRYPSWSPDGDQIVFHSNPEGDYDLYMVNADGTDIHPITDNDAQDLGPDWSPDGRYIAFHTDAWGYPFEIAILDLETGEVWRVTDSEALSSFPTWSPDGRKLAYHTIDAETSGVNIHIIGADRSEERVLITGLDRSAFPDWSPDGRSIIFQSGSDENSAIAMIPVEGGTAQPLTGSQMNFLPEWEPLY
jgi:TolB protein